MKESKGKNWMQFTRVRVNYQGQGASYLRRKLIVRDMLISRRLVQLSGRQKAKKYILLIFGLSCV